MEVVNGVRMSVGSGGASNRGDAVMSGEGAGVVGGGAG